MSSAADSLELLFNQATIDFVTRSLVRLGASRGDLEDLAQDVMVIALSKQQTFDAQRALYPWLWGIARNRLRDYRDLARHRREVVGDDSAEARASDGSAAADERLLGKALQVALGNLGDDMQLLVVLHDLESWTLGECAAGLEISVDTAKYRLQLARRSLRDQITRAEARSSRD
ncbi:MAG: sigma-70 family RNA polymerase sigma factor [Kofleriaceae bacterium]